MPAATCPRARTASTTSSAASTSYSHQTTDRPTRASCDPCRRRKLRCTGAELRRDGTAACARCCARAELCTFSAKKRMGRPPVNANRNKNANSNQDNSVSAQTPTYNQASLQHTPQLSHRQVTPSPPTPPTTNYHQQHFQPQPMAMHTPFDSMVPSSSGDMDMLNGYFWNAPNAGPSTMGMLTPESPMSDPVPQYCATPEMMSNELDFAFFVPDAPQQQHVFSTPYPDITRPASQNSMASCDSIFLQTPPVDREYFSTTPGGDHQLAAANSAFAAAVSTQAMDNLSLPPPPPSCFCHADASLSHLRGQLRTLVPSSGDSINMATCTTPTPNALETALEATARASASCAAATACPTCVADPSTSTAAFSLVSIAVQIVGRAMPSLRAVCLATNASSPRPVYQRSHSVSSSIESLDEVTMTIGGFRPNGRTATKLIVTALDAEVDALALAANELLARFQPAASDMAGDSMDAMLTDKLRQSLADVTTRVKGMYAEVGW